MNTNTQSAVLFVAAEVAADNAQAAMRGAAESLLREYGTEAKTFADYSAFKAAWSAAYVAAKSKGGVAVKEESGAKAFERLCNKLEGFDLPALEYQTTDEAKKKAAKREEAAKARAVSVAQDTEVLLAALIAAGNGAEVQKRIESALEKKGGKGKQAEDYKDLDQAAAVQAFVAKHGADVARVTNEAKEKQAKRKEAQAALQCLVFCDVEGYLTKAGKARRAELEAFIATM